MRVAYLQGAPSGHMDACLTALVAEQGASLFLTVPRGHPNAPYAETCVAADVRFPLTGFAPSRDLEEALLDFAPDVTLVVSWHFRAYRRCLRRLSGGLRVLCMDNQWLATLKQRVGVAIAPLYVQPLYDKVFLPGDRQRDFAHRLGFADDQVLSGFCSADTSLFTPSRPITASDRRRFVFVGRLVAEKGIDTLLEAYRRYRASVDDPWELMVVGTGPLRAHCDRTEGVRSLGFVQPEDLPATLNQARFLVLPSRFEPWGVVVHEATSMGLGVICSDRVGAADHRLEPGSDWVIPVDRADLLAAAMQRADSLEERQLEAVAVENLQRSKSYSPSLWAQTVVRMAEEWVAN